jgi:hypothetical protein
MSHLSMLSPEQLNDAVKLMVMVEAVNQLEFAGIANMNINNPAYLWPGAANIDTPMCCVVSWPLLVDGNFVFSADRRICKKVVWLRVVDNSGEEQRFSLVEVQAAL